MIPILSSALLFAACALDSAPARTFPADTLIDIGGRRLEIVVRTGDEPLTIVFEAGGGATLESWAAVPDSVAARTGATVVLYNRAGLGRSDLGAADLAPAEEVRGLVRALESLGVPERRIVVGHSFGGLLAVLHAALYPAAVAGLVRSTVPEYPNPADDRERLIARMTRTLEDLTARAADAEPALSIPIVVITAGEPWWQREDIVAAWRRSHQEIVGAYAGRELVVAEGSNHDVPEARPDLIVDAVVRLSQRVLAAVRARPLAAD